MIPNAAVLQRGKHFDLLLERELELIERKHEQNLIIYNKLERSIRRDNKQITNFNRKKISIPSIHEILNEKYKQPRLSIASSINSDNQNGILPKISPKYHRNCFKGQRLPPIVKLNRQKQTNKDLHWIASLQRRNRKEENLNEQFRKVSLSELTPIQKQIDSFMESLPTYKGTQRGFDNFGSSSLYTNPAPVAMR